MIDGRIVRRLRWPLHGRPRIIMRSFTAFLRISFFLLIVCLGTDAQAQAAPPLHAHRYPDAVVVKVWTPTGERWLRLERTATGYYQGSIEFESVGWMAVTEYYEFTCLMTMGVRDSPFRFHHEFRDKDGYDAAPSEFWTELRYDWDLAVFTQPEDFGVYFDDPSPAVQPSSSQASLVGGVGQSQLTLAGQTKVASPVAAGPAGPSASGREEASVDAEGYDSFGLDRSGYGRDGYDADGYDRRGVDRQGFNRAGVYQGDFDAEGYDSTGYDRDGYDREGYDHNGRDREGYDYGGFNAAGYSRYGGYLYGYDQSYALPNADGATAFDEHGFDASGLNRNGTYYDDAGYDLNGYDREGFDAQGFNPAGEYRAAPAPEDAAPWYDARGFDNTGLNANGTNYDDLGYDVFGYDLLGYDVEGYDRNGFDGAGWNRTGRDAEGYDREGRNARGFNRYGIHRNTTLYDEQGFDMQGYNRSGEYFAGYDFNQPTDKAAESKGVITGQGSGQPSGLTAQQQALAELLVAEGFPSGPQVLSDQDIAKLVAQYGSVDKITPAEWEALEKQCLDQGLTLLWYDLDNRIALVELGLSDEDPAALRAKQMKIEEYLLGLASPGASSRDVPEVASASKVGPVPSVGAAAAILAVPEPVTGWLDSVGQWMADHPRTMGAVRGVGGMAEVIAGSVATATTSGAGAPLAIPLILHGIDQVVAGAAQVVTGEQTHSRLEKVVAATAEAVGVSPQNAEIVGSVVDAVTGLALTAGVGSGPALTRAVAKEVEVGTTAAKVAASGGKVLLAAEDCNAAGLKRLFDSLPKKADNGAIAYLKSEAEITEVWAQLEKTGAAVLEVKPGVFKMALADGTYVVKYGSSTDKTLTLSFNGVSYKEALKIHLQAK
jgi:hypothetical protein